MRRYRGNKRRRGDGRKARNELRDSAKWKKTRALREIADQEGRELKIVSDRFEVQRRQVWATYRKEVGLE